jgi:hypothetical protein
MAEHKRTRWSLALASVVLGSGLAGCPGDDGSSGSTEGDGSTGSGTTNPSMTTTTAGTTTTPDDSTGSTGTPPTDSTGEPPATDGSGSSAGDTAGSTDDGNDDAGVVPDGETPCGNMVYACGDQMDNDGDGFFDLFDPECTGPCDDDEGGFQTGLPGDNVDCIQDCFFDGNSGQGDDGCFWDLTCDPANPGGALKGINCEYDASASCDNLPHNAKMCEQFCSQFVPPGCDCFGCCTVALDDGTTVDIFLNSSPDCSLANLDACESCTSQADECGHPCEPGTCELCFGQTDADLPDECDTNECTNELPCNVNEDCPTDFFCLQDCCYPPPPG